MLFALLTFYLQTQINVVSTTNESLNTIEDIKVTKLDNFFVMPIIDSKLILKLPRCIFAFFALRDQAKSPLKIH